jgi:hypothetical protein
MASVGCARSVHSRGGLCAGWQQHRTPHKFRQVDCLALAGKTRDWQTMVLRVLVESYFECAGEAPGLPGEYISLNSVIDARRTSGRSASGWAVPTLVTITKRTRITRTIWAGDGAAQQRQCAGQGAALGPADALAVPGRCASAHHTIHNTSACHVPASSRAARALPARRASNPRMESARSVANRSALPARHPLEDSAQ